MSFVQTVHTAGIGAGVFLGLLWSVKGDKITPTEHYITPGRAAYLKTQRGDDKNFYTESYGSLFGSDLLAAPRAPRLA